MFLAHALVEPERATLFVGDGKVPPELVTRLQADGVAVAPYENAAAALRLRCGIASECYDTDLQRSFDIYISDRPHPQYFHPMTPQAALGTHRRICLLTHPAQWRTNWLAISRHNLGRVLEAWRW